MKSCNCSNIIKKIKLVEIKLNFTIEFNSTFGTSFHVQWINILTRGKPWMGFMIYIIFINQVGTILVGLGLETQEQCNKIIPNEVICKTCRMPNQTKYTENTENTLMVFGFIFSTIKRTALLMFNEIALLQFENLKGLVRSRKNLLDHAKTC